MLQRADAHTPMPAAAGGHRAVGISKRGLVSAAFLIVLWAAWGSAAEGERQWFRVKSVTDGDTIILSDGRRVRYIGIDAPEIAHDDRPGEPGGIRAARFNRRLLAADRVRLEFDAEKRDRYGRWLAYVFTPEGQLVNSAMLAAGWAHCMPHPSNLRRHRQLVCAQRRAMDARLGLWRGWQKKKGHYIGNRHSKRFHNVNCPFARQTRKANRVAFSSRWKAFRAGYAPCRHCLPKWWH